MLPFPVLSKGMEVPVFSGRGLVGLTDSTAQKEETDIHCCLVVSGLPVNTTLENQIIKATTGEG